jgi:hypothetical protein
MLQNTILKRNQARSECFLFAGCRLVINEQSILLAFGNNSPEHGTSL